MGAENHESNHNGAEDQHPVQRELAQELGDHNQQKRPEHGAGNIAQPPQHHHAENQHRLVEGKRIGGDEALLGGEQGAGNPGKEGAERKGEQVLAEHVDPQRAGGHFVLPDRDPGAAEAGIDNPGNDEDRHGEKDEGEVIVVGRRRPA